MLGRFAWFCKFFQAIIGHNAGRTVHAGKTARKNRVVLPVWEAGTEPVNYSIKEGAFGLSGFQRLFIPVANLSLLFAGQIYGVSVG